MKRFICIFLISVLCFSFASCSVENTLTETTNATTTAAPTTTMPLPVIDSTKHSKEFKDSNGRTVYTVNVTVPDIKEFENNRLMVYVNDLALNIFEDTCDKAEANVENAAKFMDARNSTVPWSRKIDFEVSFSNGHYISFIIKESFSMHGEESEPSLKSFTFDIKNGTPCRLSDFIIDVFSYEEAIRIIADNYICNDVSKLFFNGNNLSEEERKLVHDVFDGESFYLTPDGIGFYLSEYEFNPLKDGVFTCNFTWAEIAEILRMPD